MDKYQIALTKLLSEKGEIFSCSSQKSNKKIDLEKAFNFETNLFTLEQEKDIFSTLYPFKVLADANIKDCQFFLNNTWHSAEKTDGCYSLILDFENRIEKIKILFADNIVDDLTINVLYVVADKNLYYAEEEKKRKFALRKTADIRCATGADLVNIYFQPCCEEYKSAEILLFIPKEELVKGYTSEGRKVVEIPSWTMIKKCKVEADDFFKSINGLAIGKYSFVLKQYDNNNSVLLETEHIEFTIKAPKQPFAGQVNVI